jgi:hypothetical protein
VWYTDKIVTITMPQQGGATNVRKGVIGWRMAIAFLLSPTASVPTQCRKYARSVSTIMR